MRVILLMLLLLGIGCRRAEPLPPPPVVRLTLHFLDQDGELGLAEVPPPGPWVYMDAGAWRPLEIEWNPRGGRGAAVLPRTAPRWVLLKDPAGEIHRIVMEEDEARGGYRPERLGDEDLEWLATVGLLWVLQWIRH
ncbi:MAG TPA: hypothetical protein VJ570_00600 [Holophagaceae bacterium]|nr:hypothetical protein [Holophagaceae bacterium]